MAPNRKKKKPAANPARGFATTSTVSKFKPEEEEEEEEEAVQQEDMGANSAINANADPEVTEVTAAAKETHRDLSELNGEDLEVHLEEAELDLMIDNFGEKSKKDSSRHIARLRTERRLLRSQAEKLNTAIWLPPEVIQIIMAALKTHRGETPLSFDSQSKPGQVHLTTDELSVKVWTLHRTLIGLDFVADRASEAISKLLGDPALIERANAYTGRDGLWGLDECLDWLSLNCEADEVPDYDENDKMKARRRLLGDAIQPVGFQSMPTPDDTTNNSGTSTLMSSRPANGDSTSNRQKHEERVIANDGLEEVIESEDDDLPPHEQLGRYLSLNTRLYQRRPDLTEIITRGPRGSKAKSGSAKPEEPADSQSIRLLKRIKRLRSDILFDRDEADAEWLKIRLEHVREDAARKRLNLVKEDFKPSSGSAESKADPVLYPPSVNGNDDLTLGFGEFFSNLPEAGIIPITTMSGDGIPMTIRDFGKWTGISPRRTFEEACKARNSKAKITYTIISSSKFSYRHSVKIWWSKPQDLPSMSPISTISWQADHRNVEVEMVGVSTPDPAQSEAYVSVVAMFLIFAASPKEEKGHLRLPPVWRDFWGELRDAQKDQDASTERETLREIRKMVGTQQMQSHSQREFPHTGINGEAVDALPHFSGSSIQNIEAAEPSTFPSLWSSKASTVSYVRMLKSRMALPIWDFKDELLMAIESNPIVIVCGETGCGKSTQVPAFILENELLHGRHCNVYCTEPRRISAISLARRVSVELGESKHDVGTSRSLVGYAIRLESKVAPQNRLCYATTGIVMRMLERGNDLEGITHLVLDEVHERTIDSDFLLIVLRKLMVRRRSLKVVLMSATVNSDQFSRYLDGAPVLNVPGRTYPVETKYLEDAIEVTNFGGERKPASKNQQEDYDEDSPDGNIKSTSIVNLQGYSVNTRNVLADFDEYRTNFDLITGLLSHISTNPLYAPYSKAILVFLPGIAEIRSMNNILGGHPEFSRGWHVYPLHSTISMDEQEQAFLSPPPGIRKIVLATNIAETGITIPDVTCVIDTGKHKEMRFDEKRQLSRLIESFISRANAKQRRGRAGRVQNGLCFHLFTKQRHDTMIPEQQTPEMLRLSLQELALRVTMLNIGGIEQTLAKALSPPLPKNVRRAIDSLIDVKALTSGETLTFLGRRLVSLPLDIYLGKLVLLGSIYKCLDACLTIAAILSSKSPFSAPMGARAQADLARLTFKKGDSDLLTVYNAYGSWKKVCSNPSMSEYHFCRKSFLSPQTLANIEELKASLVTSLMEARFLVLDDAEKAALSNVRSHSRQRHFVVVPPDLDANGNNTLIINSVIAWSFYPKLLSRDGNGWKNVVNNQYISVQPTSVNKSSTPSKFLSFYHIMSSKRLFHAIETSAMEDFAVAIMCGEAEIKMYSGVIILDGNRIRFAINDWKTMIALKTLRLHLREIMTMSFRNPGRPLSVQQKVWFEIWQTIFTQVNLLKTKR